MRANLLKTNQQGQVQPATKRGPKPGDFALGSAESRAAARATVHQLTTKRGPQPGDIVVDLTFLGLERATEIWHLSNALKEDVRACTGTYHDETSPPRIWLKFPEGFDAGALPENKKTVRDFSDESLCDYLRVCKQGHREAKDAGHELPPDNDPDLVWDGTAYVPAKNPRS